MDRIAIARRALNNTTSSSRCSFLRRSNVVCCNRNTSILSTRCAHPSIIRHQFSSLPTPSNSSSLQSKEESNNELTVDPNAHLIPIDYTTSSVIQGEESQILEIQLKSNQMVRAESGAMLYMTDGVQMETSMGLGGSSSGSGLSAGLTRMMTGQNLMVSDFSYTKRDGHGTIALGTDFPAKILRFSLDEYPNAKLVCQKGAYLAGSHSVAMEMAYTKNLTSGFFGGEGFILQSLQATNIDGSGDETVFLKAYGTVVKKDLLAGETLRVSSGSLVCMTSDIDYDVSMMPGFKNVMFGGEGLFVTTLKGPGSVWLQGMPVDRMVSEIARHIPSGGGIGLGIPIGMGGGGGGEGAAAGDMAAGEAAGELAAEGGEEESGVPLAEDAVDADRNATIASSGMESSSSDPESSKSLFGDAAYGGEQTGTSSSSTNEDSFSSTADDFSNNGDNMNMPEFEEPTMTEEQFEDDGTTFSTYDEGSESTAAETEVEGVDMPTDDEEGPGLLGQLWDMFRDFTDDD